MEPKSIPRMVVLGWAAGGAEIGILDGAAIGRATPAIAAIGLKHHSLLIGMLGINRESGIQAK
jgi:hypothetical protein